MSELNAAALLEKLIEQNAELLRAHQEGMRLQRLLVEHLVGARAADAPAAAPASADRPTGAAPGPEVAPVAVPAMRSSSEPLPPTDDDAPPEQPPDQEPSSESTRPRPMLRVVPPPRRTTLPSRPTLAALHRLAHIGEEGQIVLNFGPHHGRTLAAVAAADPGYLMTLAARAQRPDVRVAARRVASVLNNRGHHER